jgi:hypothetical protein
MVKPVAALCVLLAACEVSSGKLPVIDELVMPDSVTIDADGTYHVDGTISYHDEDDTVSRVRVEIPAIRASAQYPASGTSSATRASLAIRIVGTAPKGATTINVNVLDREGNASDTKVVTVTLK